MNNNFPTIQVIIQSWVSLVGMENKAKVWLRNNLFTKYELTQWITSKTRLTITLVSHTTLNWQYKKKTTTNTNTPRSTNN